MRMTYPKWDQVTDVICLQYCILLIMSCLIDINYEPFPILLAKVLKGESGEGGFIETIYKTIPQTNMLYSVSGTTKYDAVIE